MIKAIVRTNQDNVSCIVTEFFVLPRIGERVMVSYKGERIFSKVSSVSHYINDHNHPVVEIELWCEAIHRMNNR